MKWSYKTVHFELKKEGLLGGSFLDEAEIEEQLNQFGQSGWELISVIEVQNGIICFFRQPLTPASGRYVDPYDTVNEKGGLNSEHGYSEEHVQPHPPEEDRHEPEPLEEMARPENHVNGGYDQEHDQEHEQKNDQEYEVDEYESYDEYPEEEPEYEETYDDNYEPDDETAEELDDAVDPVDNRIGAIKIE